MGRAVGPEGGCAVRQVHPRTRRQQRDDRGAVGRSRDGVARHRVLGSGHRGTALHEPAPADRARRRLRVRSIPRLKNVYQRLAIGDPLDARHAGRSVDRRAPRSRGCSARSPQRERKAASSPAASACWSTHPECLLCAPRHRRNAGADRDRARRDVRADSLRDEIPRARASHRHAQRRAAGAVVVHLHDRRARGGNVPVGERFRLRHRERQHRTVGRRNRRCVRRREGHGRRPRIRFGRVEEPTCGGRRTRSTIRARCRSRRASSSTI